MEPESSLRCSQQPATGPCPEAEASSPQLPNCFPKNHCNISSPSTLMSFNFPYQKFLPRVLHAPLRIQSLQRTDHSPSLGHSAAILTSK
jgi:hypothetical protein